MIETARITCTDSRAIKNSKSLFQCLESLISGSVKTLIFTQPGHILIHEDGIYLFHLITQYTAVSFLQLSNMSLQQILIFNPANSDFQIPNISTELISLFTLETTQNKTLHQREQIQHTLKV